MDRTDDKQVLEDIICTNQSEYSSAEVRQHPCSPYAIQGMAERQDNEVMFRAAWAGRNVAYFLFGGLSEPPELNKVLFQVLVNKMSLTDRAV